MALRPPPAAREVAALIALRSVFRMLGLGNCKILGLAMEIGAWLEHEQEALAWKRDDADSWKRMSLCVFPAGLQCSAPEAVEGLDLLEAYPRQDRPGRSGPRRSGSGPGSP